MRRQLLYGFASLVGLASITLLLRAVTAINPTTIALAYLLVVLFVAAVASLWTAVVTSVVAVLGFNYFFLPPVGALTLADPSNWVALFAFLVVSLVASQLSTSARHRTLEAMERRRELTRLFDLTRDILLTTERDGALAAIARHVARRFDLDVVASADRRLAGGPSIRAARQRQSWTIVIWITCWRVPSASSSSTQGHGPTAAIGR